MNKMASFAPSLPSFVALDDGLLCIVCASLLRPPVIQTECGHRMCKECLQGLHKDERSAIPCPSKDETCGILISNKVHRDSAAELDLGNQLVYCPERNHGCMIELKWKKLEDHVENHCSVRGRWVHCSEPLANEDSANCVSEALVPAKWSNAPIATTDQSLTIQSSNGDTVVVSGEPNASIAELNRKIHNLKRDQAKDDQRRAELTDKIGILENCSALIDTRLAASATYLQQLESTSYDGNFTWKITGYGSLKLASVCGSIMSLNSNIFYNMRYGYKMCLRVYLNGDGIGKGTDLSVFFVVMKGENDAVLRWPFRQKVTLRLLDQQVCGVPAKLRYCNKVESIHPDNSKKNRKCFTRPLFDMNPAFGFPKFARQSELEKAPFLVDDTIYISCQVETGGMIPKGTTQ